MKHFKKLIALALVAVSIVTVALPAIGATLQAGRGIVKTGGGSLPVYQFANTTAPHIGYLSNGYEYLFRYNSPKDHWLRVSVKNGSGFVLASKVHLFVNMPGSSSQVQAFGPDSESIELHNRGNRVRNVQLILKKEGLSGGQVDGSFGGNTLKGVKEYQQKHNLAIDGIVGPSTKRSMWNNHHIYLRERGYKN